MCTYSSDTAHLTAHAESKGSGTDAYWVTHKKKRKASKQIAKEAIHSNCATVKQTPN